MSISVWSSLPIARGPCSEPVAATEYHYDLPEQAIAQAAIEPRHDSASLDRGYRFLSFGDAMYADRASA